MKLIKIPTCIDDIQDLSIFKEAIKETIIFKKNSEDFAKKIVTEKFLKTYHDLKTFLSEKDFKLLCKPYNTSRYAFLEDKEDKGLYLYDYKNKDIQVVDSGYYDFMGAFTSKEYNYTFNYDGSIIILYVTWKTKKARFNHIPWVKQEEYFYIDYINDTLYTQDDYNKLEYEYNKDFYKSEYIKYLEDKSYINRIDDKKLLNYIFNQNRIKSEKQLLNEK